MNHTSMPLRLYIRILGCLFMLSASCAIALAQTHNRPVEQEQTVRIKTELIQVRAVVNDKQGQVVDSLKQEDFEVLENGKPQKLEFFSLERVVDPLRAAPVPVKSNDRSPQPTSPVRPDVKPARSIALFVDTQHLSPISVLQIKQTLRRFIDQQMTDQDLVAVIPSGGSVGMYSQFTRDKHVLRLAIEKLAPWRPDDKQSFFSPYLAARVIAGDNDAMQTAIQIFRVENPQYDKNTNSFQTLSSLARNQSRIVLSEASNKRRSAMSRLKAVTELMAELPGQRLIFLLSDGFSLADIGGMTSNDEVQPIVSRATRSGVVIYSFDAKRLQPTMISAETSGAAVARAFGSQNYSEITSLSSTMDVGAYVERSLRDLELGMQDLAAATGGESFFGANDLNGRMQKALTNNRVYYVLSYYPAEEGSAKKLRKITVRVKDRPEYNIRAQKEYLPSDLTHTEEEAKTQTLQQKLSRAMASPLPITTVGVSVTASYFERENDKATVTLQTHIEGEGLDYHVENGLHGIALQVATVIFDAAGKQINGASDEIKGQFPPDKMALAKRNGLRSRKSFALPPGLYQARVAVLEISTQRMGSAVAWVEVPKPEPNKLHVSSLLLVEKVGGAESADQSDLRIKQGVRYYRKGDTLMYQLRVSPPANMAEPESKLLVQTQILEGEQVAYQSQWLPLSERLGARDSKGLEIFQDIKLNAATPGVYELRLFIKDPKSNQIIARSALFGVEP
jgi:VWFA-related protein